MNTDILNTIEVLNGKVRTKEEEANKLKKLVNELCAEAGVDPHYPDIPEAGGLSTIRADQFYGQTLTAAIRNYLERRKASNLGAASVVDIFKAVKDGGYKFDTNNEDNAKISVSNTLRKSSSVFHRLPNGQYGLLSWYPTARAPKEDEAKRPKRTNKKNRQESSATNGESADLVTKEDVRDVILSQVGEFQISDTENAIKTK